VSHVHDLDAPDPALQQADRGVECPAGGRRTVVTDHKVQESCGRHGSRHGGKANPCAICVSLVTGGSSRARGDRIQISRIWRVQVMTWTESACA